MTSFASRDRVERGRKLLAQLNSTTSTIGVSHTAPVVILAQSGGQVADVLVRSILAPPRRAM